MHAQSWNYRQWLMSMRMFESENAFNKFGNLYAFSMENELIG